MNNSDMFRQMTDDELAGFLAYATCACPQKFFDKDFSQNDTCHKYATCKECALAWLGEETE